jgi:CHAT domain-containing protein
MRVSGSLIFAALIAFGAHAATPPSRADVSAIAAAERVHGAKSREVADALARAIDATRDDFRIETDAEAFVVLARREVALRSALDGESSLVYAQALGRLGYALAAVYANDEAERTFARAKEIIDALRPAASADVRANAAIDLGYIRRLQRKDLAQASDVIESGLALAPTLPARRRAQALIWLAGCEWYLRHTDRFAAALDRADTALAEAAMPRHPDRVEILRWRALAALDGGHFPEAIDIGDRAVEAAAHAMPYSVTTHTAALDTRGQIEQRVNNYAAAQGYFEQAVALQSAHPTGGGYYLGMMHYELCANAGFLDRPATAEPECRAAIASLERVAAPPAIVLAGAYNNLGASLGNQNRDADAAEPFRQSLAWSEKVGALAPLSFTAELGLADVHYAQGSYTDAEALLRKHLARVDTMDDFALKNPRATEAMLAAVLLGEGRRDEAFALAAKVEHSAAVVRRVMASDLDQHRAVGGTASIDGGLDWMIATAAAEPRADWIEQIWQAALEANGTVTAMTARRLAAAHAASDPTLAAPWQEWQRRNAALAHARVALAKQPDAATRAALLDAERAFDAAELALAAHAGSSGRRLASQHADFAEIRAALPKETALVRFVESRAGPHAFRQPPPAGELHALVLSGAGAPRLVALGETQPIADAIARWYRLAADPGAESAAVSEAARVARHLIFDPLAGVLSAKRVFVVGSPALDRVNFAALETDDGHFLVETGPAFHQLDHERDLLRASSITGAPTLLLAGAPDFGDAYASAGERGLCAGLHDAPFADLPGSRAELKTLATLGERAHLHETVLEGGAASEAAVRAALGNNTIVHLATHGVFLGDRCAPAAAATRSVALVREPVTSGGNDLASLSALAFADANHPAAESANDGLLTSDEIAALDLDGVQWAVLSACETALGAATAREGVLGLRRAFRLAGARTVIMSLWRVNDRATEAFMGALYEERLERHADTIDAMQAAMRGLLASRRRAGESIAPYYWAAFVAAGDWR